jgi:glycosyltransferase involved in cell wall biosynthesis
MLAEMRILALEPFHGGSHRAFLEGWQRHSRHSWTTLGLPARKWKWRMRQSPLLFAWEIDRRYAKGERWDLLFCSDMLPLAELRGLCRPAAELPSVIYFHENQITYPVRFEKERDFHFGLSNVTSAVAADACWFNSGYHLDDFLGAIPRFLRRMPGDRPLAAVELIAERSSVRHPGIEIEVQESRRRAATRRGATSPEPLHIVWAARWEHDKDPEAFFEALTMLVERGVDFRVSVLGQSFDEEPPVFERARVELGDRVSAWGFRESRAEYEAVLGSADVFVSTAQHEFFGLAAVEAMALGVRPLLPNRLSYPELLELGGVERSESYLFDGGIEALAARLEQLARAPRSGLVVDADLLAGAVKRLLWSELAATYDDELAAMAESSSVGSTAGL